MGFQPPKNYFKVGPRSPEPKRKRSLGEPGTSEEILGLVGLVDIIEQKIHTRITQIAYVDIVIETSNGQNPNPVAKS